MAAARPLVEGTALSEGAIARRLGVAPGSVARWRKLYGWTRPPEAPTFLPPPRADGLSRPVRSRLRRGKPYMTDAVEGARVLLTTTLLSQKAIAKQIGVSQWWVGQIMRRRGWERPAVPSYSRRFAAGRRVGVLATQGDRRGRPYAPELRKEARFLWEFTLLPTSLIGARLGVGPSTISLWSLKEGWERPKGRAGARQLRGYYASLRGSSAPRRG
jgi:DNA-binding transcriptional regulator YdaS (Cro superfamily)